MQHLAAVVAMGRAWRFTKRENSHDRASAQGHSQILLFSSHPNVPSLPDHTSTEGGHSPTSTIASPITPLAAVEEEQLQRPSPPMQVDSDSLSIGSASMTSQDVDGRSSSFTKRNGLSSRSPSALFLLSPTIFSSSFYAKLYLSSLYRQGG